MKIEVNLEKKHLAIFLTAMFLMTLTIVIAQTQSVPNPGHSVTEIAGAQKKVTGTCNTGIKSINEDGSVTCATATSSLDWNSITNKPSGFADNTDNNVVGGVI